LLEQQPSEGDQLIAMPLMRGELKFAPANERMS
jgi:hypothetical protein